MSMGRRRHVRFGSWLSHSHRRISTNRYHRGSVRCSPAARQGTFLVRCWAPVRQGSSEPWTICRGGCCNDRITGASFIFSPTLAVQRSSTMMQLSVLSALARMDVDPWEEATHLAAMPKAIAERTLVSTLDRVVDKSWSPSETEVIAARLVQLLPQRGEGMTVAPTEIARVGMQQTHWLVWLGFALAISLLSPRHQTTTPDGGSTSKSGATSQLESGSVRSQRN
jgi:hypothetical protein